MSASTRWRLRLIWRVAKALAAPYGGAPSLRAEDARVAVTALKVDELAEDLEYLESVLWDLASDSGKATTRPANRVLAWLDEMKGEL